MIRATVVLTAASLLAAACSSGSSRSGAADGSAAQAGGSVEASASDGARNLPGAETGASADALSVGDATRDLPGALDGALRDATAGEASLVLDTGGEASLALDGAKASDTPVVVAFDGASPSDASGPRDAVNPDGVILVDTKASETAGDTRIADAAPEATDLPLRDDAPAPGCGDGIVNGSELCDVAIAAGQAGACPTVCSRTDPCQPRQLVGSGCNRACQDQAPITKISTSPDMCCAGVRDPDCIGSYPVQKSGSDVMSLGSNPCSNGSYPPWDYDSEVSIYMPLGPTCGVPVLVTVDGQTPGNGRDNSADAQVSVKYLSGKTVTSRQVTLDHDGVQQTSFLVDMPGAQPAFVTGIYTDYACTRTAFTTSAVFDARPFVGVPVLSGGSPRRVRLAGDRLAQFVVVEDAPTGTPSTIKIISGNILPVRWVRDMPGSHTEEASFTPLQTVTVSTTGVAASEPSLAVEPTAPTGTTGSMPFAHLAWVEGDGAELRYARVATDGTIANRRTIQAGTGIHAPQLIVFDDQILAITWSELSGGKSRIKLGTLQMATGTVGSIIDVTLGEGDAIEPTISSAFDTSSWRAGVAWVDTRSGSRALAFREILRSGSLGTQTLSVSSAAVSPADPILLASGTTMRLAWTDARQGPRALFVKESTSTLAFADAADLPLSPPGEDAHHVRLAQKTPTLEATGRLARLGDGSLRALFEVGDAGNRVRYLDADILGNAVTLASGSDSLLLSCAAASAAPDTTVLDASPVRSSTSPLRLAVWIEGNAVMIQSLNSLTLGYTP